MTNEQQPRTIKRYQRKREDGRLWYGYRCNVCDPVFMFEYLSKDAMIKGSITHREKHGGK